MGFWRSLRQWWSWDGSPDTDPFRDPEAAADDQVSGDVSAPLRGQRGTGGTREDDET